MIRCKCPFCRYTWEAKEPANLALFTRCPNPTNLPADVPAKGPRLCMGDLRRSVFTLTPSGAWGKP